MGGTFLKEGGQRLDKVWSLVSTANLTVTYCHTMMLQEKGGDLVPNDSLRNLSVYLTLQKAEQAGFKASDYGLDEEKSAIIAAVFSKYDTNDDFVLSTYEVNQLL